MDRLRSTPNGVTNNYAYYVVFKGQYIILGTDPVNANDPLTLGTVLVQTGSGFSNGSLSGNSIYEASALAPNNGSPQAVVTLGLLDVLSAGSAQVSLDQNQGGALTQQQVSQGTFSVASNGKVTLTGFGGTPPIIYLYNTNQGFTVGQDSSVAQGVLEPQTAIPPYNNFSIFGTYLGGTIGPVEVPVEDAVSYVLADGNGTLTECSSIADPRGPAIGRSRKPTRLTPPAALFFLQEVTRRESCTLFPARRSSCYPLVPTRFSAVSRWASPINHPPVKSPGRGRGFFIVT